MGCELLGASCFGRDLPVIRRSTPVDGESDRTVELDTNINCLRFLFKIINTYVNTFILLVFYIVVCHYFISALIFNRNVSDTISVSDSTLLSDSLSMKCSGNVPVNARLLMNIV